MMKFGRKRDMALIDPGDLLLLEFHTRTVYNWRLKWDGCFQAPFIYLGGLSLLGTYGPWKPLSTGIVSIKIVKVLSRMRDAKG